MDPESRFYVTDSQAPAMAEAVYLHNSLGNATQLVPLGQTVYSIPESLQMRIPEALVAMAAVVGTDWTAEVLYISDVNVVVGFIAPNGNPVGVGIRGTDELVTEALNTYPSIGWGGVPEDAEQIASGIAAFARPELGLKVVVAGHSSGGWLSDVAGILTPDSILRTVNIQGPLMHLSNLFFTRYGSFIELTELGRLLESVGERRPPSTHIVSRDPGTLESIVENAQVTNGGADALPDVVISIAVAAHDMMLSVPTRNIASTPVACHCSSHGLFFAI